MAERNKVLAALLQDGSFNVGELATLTGVNPRTVRTVLARDRNLLDEFVEDSKGDRGRPRKRFQLKSSSREHVRQELQSELDDIQRYVGPLKGGGQLPLSVIAAHEAMLEVYPAATTASAKSEALARSQEFLLDARSEVEADNFPPENRSSTRASIDAIAALVDSFKGRDENSDEATSTELVDNAFDQVLALQRMDPSSPILEPLLKQAVDLQRQLATPHAATPTMSADTPTHATIAMLQRTFDVGMWSIGDERLLLVDGIEEESDWVTPYMEYLIAKAGGRSFPQTPTTATPPPLLCLLTVNSNVGTEAALQTFEKAHQACPRGKFLVFDAKKNRVLGRILRSRGGEYGGATDSLTPRNLRRMLGRAGLNATI